MPERLAVSDRQIGHAANRTFVDSSGPRSLGDEVSLGSPQEWTGPGAKPRRVVRVAGGQAGA